VSGLVFGLIPALRSSRPRLHEYLKDAARGSAGGAVWGRRQRGRRLLVVSELALSAVVLVGAGLLVRSFASLQRVPPGFDPSSVLTLELTMTGRKYADADAVLETYRRLWGGLAALPGATAVGGVTALPLSQMMAWGPITVEGRHAPAGQDFVNVDLRIAGGEYFEAMRIPLRRGRLFTEADTRTSQRVAVVDEHMAAQLWPGQDPIGRRLRTGGMDASPDAPWITVVGVVGRVKQDALDSDPRMAMYRAHTQSPSRSMNVVVRSAGDPDGSTRAVRRVIAEIDPDLPVYGMRSMERRVEDSLARRRFAMLLLSLFAALALGLAAIGVYGVMAYLVSQGAREVGIRMALGATPRRILALVFREGMSVALTGLAIGLGAAFVLTRSMEGLLFGVGATDIVTYAAIAFLMTCTALLAIYVPARRAARVDPMMSLRTDG
jgi:predicted permease